MTPEQNDKLTERIAKTEQDIVAIKAFMIRVDAELTASLWIEQSALSDPEKIIFVAKMTAYRKKIITLHIEEIEKNNPILAASIMKILNDLSLKSGSSGYPRIDYSS